MEEVRTYSTAQKSVQSARGGLLPRGGHWRRREWEEEAMTAVAKVNGGGGEEEVTRAGALLCHLPCIDGENGSPLPPSYVHSQQQSSH